MKRTTNRKVAIKRLSMNFVVCTMISFRVFEYLRRLRVKSVYHRLDHTCCFWFSTIYANVKRNDWHYKNLRYVWQIKINAIYLHHTVYSLLIEQKKKKNRENMYINMRCLICLVVDLFYLLETGLQSWYVDKTAWNIIVFGRTSIVYAYEWAAGAEFHHSHGF